MHYLSNLWAALDFGSLLSMVTRLAAVLLCLTVHESCHGLAAYALGDPTARYKLTFLCIFMYLYKSPQIVVI